MKETSQVNGHRTIIASSPHTQARPFLAEAPRFPSKHNHPLSSLMIIGCTTTCPRRRRPIRSRWSLTPGEPAFVTGAVAMARPITGALNVVATIGTPNITGSSILRARTLDQLPTLTSSSASAATNALPPPPPSSPQPAATPRSLVQPGTSSSFLQTTTASSATKSTAPPRAGHAPSTIGYIGWMPLINSSTPTAPRSPSRRTAAAILVRTSSS